MEPPLTYWVPSIAPSGLTFIKNGQPNNEADVLIGALAGTHIHWLKLKDNLRISSKRSLNGYARFRDIRQAPDGKIYAMTETPNRFVLLRSNIPILSTTDNKKFDEANNFTIYPNPSITESTLSFVTAKSQIVSARLFASNGSLIKELTSQTFSAGKHSLQLKSDELPQGLYFIEIDKDGTKMQMKLIKK
jgi:hypothetical protein